ncbi:zinc finger protein 771-like [Scleropages formosus]|uniref:zinc finger protein 771-like n=1 Tax=Scleropages formosus TaxID=113540 RepID=UPI0010FA7667|nr:zinc finger protein 771-like [Scleropages formosus]XP_029101911.1 zinc finger protein 771-like [Scleropages formosus]
MEPFCVNGASLDPNTLMVIVKQEEEEEEEQEEQFSEPQVSSLLVIKQEKEEEPGGHSAPLVMNICLPKDEPDTLEGKSKEKKAKRRRKKRLCEEKEWAPTTAEETPKNDSLWQCRLCHRCFSSSWELTGHCCTGIINKDDGDAAKLEFRCPVCGDRFLRPTAFIMHKRSHVGQSRYVCGICGRTLKTLRKLSSHRRSHTRHQCQYCSRSFCSFEALRGHRLSQHGQEIDEEEGDSMTPPSNASSHLAQLPQSPQCLRCFMTFRDAETAERHLRFKHPAEYEQQLRGHTVFACCVCDRTFPSSRLLSAHQRTHSKWSLTPTCMDKSLQGKEAQVERKLESEVQEQRTYKSETDKDAASSMRCLHCHIIFTDPRTWERHMIAKHPPSPPLIPPSVTGPGHLTLRPPRGQPRPYSCSICGERFIQESSLTKHYTETHTSSGTENVETKKENNFKSNDIK